MENQLLQREHENMKELLAGVINSFLQGTQALMGQFLAHQANLLSGLQGMHTPPPAQMPPFMSYLPGHSQRSEAIGQLFFVCAMHPVVLRLPNAVVPATPAQTAATAVQIDGGRLQRRTTVTGSSDMTAAISELRPNTPHCAGHANSRGNVAATDSLAVCCLVTAALQASWLNVY
ncbi:hypothetical protein MRX96_028043 [Rhipicephalus microplus]